MYDSSILGDEGVRTNVQGACNQKTDGIDIDIMLSLIVDLVGKEDEQTKLRRCIEKAPCSGLEKGLPATNSTMQSTDAQTNLLFTSILENRKAICYSSCNLAVDEYRLRLFVFHSSPYSGAGTSLLSPQGGSVPFDGRVYPWSRDEDRVSLGLSGLQKIYAEFLAA